MFINYWEFDLSELDTYNSHGFLTYIIRVQIIIE